MFKSIYDKNLKLNIYGTRFLSSADDVETFKSEDKKDYLLSYNQQQQQGGRISNKIKIIKIIKSYK